MATLQEHEALPSRRSAGAFPLRGYGRQELFIADRAGPVSAGVVSRNLEEVFTTTGTAEEARRGAEQLAEAARRTSDERLRVLALCKRAEAGVLEPELRPEIADEALSAVREARSLCDELGDFEEGEAAATWQTESSIVVKLIVRFVAEVSYASARCQVRFAPGDEEAQAWEKRERDRALDEGSDAAALCRVLGCRKGEAASLSTVGDAYHVMKDATKAVDYHKQALAVFKDMGDKSCVAFAYTKISEDYRELKLDAKKASNNMKQAIVLFQELQNAQEEGQCWHHLARIHAMAGEAESVIECITNARTLFQAVKDHASETRAMETLVQMLLDNDRYEEAIKLGKEIVTVNHAAGDKEGEARSLTKLAEHLLRNYDWANAEKVASVANLLFKSLREKEGIDVTQRMKDIAEHQGKAGRLEASLAQQQDFLHLPQPLMIDPGRKKRMQEAYNAFAKAA
ncbi:TTC28 [Symbiodinium pilosum]|uniref:TTC28 protein n=1 Tax=Symbiodinium pilosum TaxID=2952 RepID=A0A812KM84_SYMPI|nr:TTC28 [Symbiodinium pilosum]